MINLNFFKDLAVSKIIRDSSNSLWERLARAYPDDVLAYFGNFEGLLPPPTTAEQKTRPPFVNEKNKPNYQQDPNQVQQIKDLFNGLYHLEQVFISLEGLGEQTFRSIMNAPGLPDHAYKACYFLNQLSVGFLADFQEEIGDASQYFNLAYEFSKTCVAQGSQHSKLQEAAYNLGKLTGHAVDQMGPHQGGSTSALISELSIRLPEQIESLRIELESLQPTMTQKAPNANYDELEKLRHEGEQLARTIRNASNPLSLLFNSLRLIHQISKSLSRISQQCGNLDDSAERLIISILARIKYDLLAKIFSFVDKSELQLMHKPRTLSSLLMTHLTSYYDLLIGLSQSLVNFDEKAKNLLHLEDESFLRARLAPLVDDLDDLERIKHQTRLVQAQIQELLSGIETYELNEDLIADVNDALVEVKKNASFLSEAQLVSLRPLSDNVPFNTPVWGCVAQLQTLKQTLNELTLTLKQRHTNLDFKIQQRQRHKQEVEGNARLMMLPRAKALVSQEINDQEVLLRTHLTRPILKFNAQKKLINEVADLTELEQWELYREYLKQEKQLDALITAANELLTHYQEKPPFELISLTETPITLHLNKEDPPFDVNIFEIETAEGDRLRYNLEHELPALHSNLHLMSLAKARRESLLDAYVYSPSTKKLYYFDQRGQESEQEGFKLITGEREQPQNDAQIAFKRNDIFLKIIDGKLLYNARIAKEDGCYFYTLSLYEARKKELRDCYVLDKQRLNYITPDGRIELLHQNFHISATNLEPTKQTEANTYYFNESQRCAYIVRNGVPHQPLRVAEGEILLTSLDCPLTSLRSLDELTPYRAKILTEIYRRGEIEDVARQGLLNNYSKLQAFSLNLPKNAYPSSFQVRLCASLMGEKPKSKSQPNVRVIEAKNWLDYIKNRARIEKEQVSAQKEKYAEGLSELSLSAPLVKNPLSQANVLSHDLAELLNSEKLFCEKLNESRKVLFKLVVIYRTRTLSSDERKKLKTLEITHRYLESHYKQLLLNIKRNQLAYNYHRENIQEKVAILSHLPSMKTELINDKALKAGTLQLQKDDETLSYRFLYYGEELFGSIPLVNIKPALKKLDASTIIHYKTKASIIENIVKQRVNQLNLPDTTCYVDELIDLYFWYRERAHEVSENIRSLDVFQNSLLPLGKASEASEQQIEHFEALKPFLKSFVPSHHLQSFEQAFAVLRSAREPLRVQLQTHLEELKEKKNAYQDKARALVGEKNTSCLLAEEKKKPEASKSNREDHLLKTTALSRQISKLRAQLASLESYLSPTLQEACRPKKNEANDHLDDDLTRYYVTSDGDVVLWEDYQIDEKQESQPFPEVMDETTTLEVPYQLLAYKRLANLLFGLEQAAIKLESMNNKQSSYAYVSDLANGYLEFQQALNLYYQLKDDPYLNAFCKNILESINDVSRKITLKIKYYEPNDYEHHSQTPYLTTALNALYELPTHIRKKANQTEEARVKLTASRVDSARTRASQVANKIERLSKRVVFYLGLSHCIHRFFDFFSSNHSDPVSSIYNGLISVVDLVISTITQLPMLAESAEVINLLLELKARVSLLANSTNERVLEELPELRKNYLNEISVKIDQLETRYALSPGMLSTPLNKALDQFYLGLLTPLCNVKKRIRLIKDHQGLMGTRIRNSYIRLTIQETKRKVYQRHLTDIETLRSLLAKKTPGQYNVLKYFKVPQVDSELKSAIINVVPLLENALITNDQANQFPFVRHSLTGCQVHFISEEDAAELETPLKDTILCFSDPDSDSNSMKFVYIGRDGVHREHLELTDSHAFGLLMSQKLTPDVKKIHLSSQELQSAIVDKLVSPPPSLLPLQINQEELHSFLELKKNVKTNHFPSETFTILETLKPLIEKSEAHTKGLINSSKLSYEINQRQRNYLKADRRNQQKNDYSLIQQIFEEHFDETVNTVCFSQETAELFQVGYRTDLQAALQKRKEQFFNQTEIKRRLVSIQFNDKFEADADALKTQIEKVIKDNKETFDKTNLAAYKTLKKIRKSVNKFRKYLNEAESKCYQHRSLFENEYTLTGKREVINTLEDLLSEDLNPKEKVRSINNYFRENKNDILFKLTNHHQADPWSLQRVRQGISELYHAIFNQPPAYLQHYLALQTKNSELCPPPPAKSVWCTLFQSSQQSNGLLQEQMDEAPPSPTRFPEAHGVDDGIELGELPTRRAPIP